MVARFVLLCVVEIIVVVLLALQVFASQDSPVADEDPAGGDAEVPGAVLNVGCAVVTDGRRESLGLSSAFSYPPECLGPALDDRAPIGEVFDRLWSRYAGDEAERLPSAETSGNVGKLTLGVLQRSDYARHAVLCALVRFLHPSLYFSRREPGSAPGLAGAPFA